MSKRTMGVILLVLGAVLLIVSLFSDVIGIGDRAGIGWAQITGAIVGGLLVLGGGWLYISKRVKKSKPIKDG